MKPRIKVLALTEEGYEEEVYLSKSALKDESKEAYTSPTGKEKVKVKTYRYNLPSILWQNTIGKNEDM